MGKIIYSPIILHINDGETMFYNKQQMMWLSSKYIN